MTAASPAAAPSPARADVLRRDLWAITWDGAAFSVMLGCGERYVQAFAVALGYGDLASGFVATIPWLAGAAIQLVAPWAVPRVGSQKRWVIACSAVQAAAWAPLAVGAAMGWMPPFVLFACVTLYWASGFAAGPAWTSWVETLIPPRLRDHFFARRGAVCQASLFVALVGAGALLHAAEGAGIVMRMFAILFAAAAVARAISTAFLTFQSEPVPLPPRAAAVTVAAFLRRLPGDAPLRLLFCVVPMQFAVQTAEPFFAPYVLRRLDADYGTYLVLVAAAFLGRIVALPPAGRLARRFGARRVLWAGALGLVPVAALWTLSTSFVWLAVVQLLAGLAWGCFELGTFLVYFDAVEPHERSSAITAFFFVNAAAAAGGSLAGGWFLDALGADRDAYLALFAASTVLRMAALLFTRGLRAGPSPRPRLT